MTLRAACLLVAAFLSTGCSNREVVVPDWVVYPGDAWQATTPEAAGFDNAAWQRWLAAQEPRGSRKYGEDHSDNRWGAVIVRGGYRVQAFGDPDYRHQSASVGKAFTRLALQLAVDEGRIASVDAPLHESWSGRGELNHPDKYLDRSPHDTLTFRHTMEMRGGFPVSNGWSWSAGRDVPAWANPHDNDPDRANYAHVPPGSRKRYSSGGYWRTSQVLTRVFDQSLKDVLDERLFGALGIPPERWSWLSGRHVRENVDFYPGMPGYGGFVDPPYEIDGHDVVGGGGWVVMSPDDLARVGLLIAGGGVWDGQRLVSDSFLLKGWPGGNDSGLTVDRKRWLIVAWVTTAGFDPEGLSGMISEAASPP